MLVLLLLLGGEGCWLAWGYGINRRPFEVAAAIVLLMLIPPVRRWAADALDRIREPTWTAANRAALGVAVAATLLLYGFAIGRSFIPTWHDEHSHLIQAQMLARGRLWMPQHPIADFFATFHVFVKPVYASLYFPGTSLLYVPTVWLGLPYWLIPLLVAGASVGLMYRVLTELVDGVAGVLGAMFLLSMHSFRLVSVMLLSHPHMLLWGLVIVWAWLGWRRDPTWRWALLFGVASGWALVTRPLDSLCFIAPLGVSMLRDLRGKAISAALGTLALVAAGMIPFVTLQLVDDYGITGHVLESPYADYWTKTYGGTVVGFAPPDPGFTPPGPLRQMQVYHQTVNVPMLLDHTPATILPNLVKKRLPTLFGADLPDPILLLLFPVGLLGLTDSRRRLVWSILPLLIAVYSLFPFFLQHYALPATLPVALTVTLAIGTMAETWPRHRRAIATVLALVVGSLAVTAMPRFRAGLEDQIWAWPVMTAVHVDLPRLVKTPAVVLFPYHVGDNPHEEPVYNVDVAWPDDAPIIHVQDFGPERDQELAAYYARTQPDRNFYRFDRRDGTLTPLGKPAEFLARLRAEVAAKSGGRPVTP